MHEISQFQMNNLQAALAAWQTVKPAEVELGWWRAKRMYNDKGWTAMSCCEIPEAGTPECGTPACFGGWLPHFEHFKTLGVVTGPCGEPRWGDHLLRGTGEKLFGWWLFGADGDEVYSGELKDESTDRGLSQRFRDDSHWQQVQNRITWAIAHSVVKHEPGSAQAV